MATVVSGENIEGKEGYLIFSAQGENFAIEVSRVCEVVKAGELTPIPGVRDVVVGIAVHRGAIVPIFDLVKLLGERGIDKGRFDRCIVVKYNGEFLGFFASEVIRVAPISDYEEREIKKGNFMTRGVVVPPYPWAIVLDWDRVLNLSPEELVS
jgi:chemotaxis signal transduction protein